MDEENSFWSQGETPYHTGKGLSAEIESKESYMMHHYLNDSLGQTGQIVRTAGIPDSVTQRASETAATASRS